MYTQIPKHTVAKSKYIIDYSQRAYPDDDVPSPWSHPSIFDCRIPQQQTNKQFHKVTEQIK